MNTYKSIQFALDGDYITDYECNTVQKTWDKVDDQGSKWFFYPLPFVVRAGGGDMSRKRVHAPDFPLLRDLEGASVKTVQRFIRENSETLADILNG